MGGTRTDAVRVSVEGAVARITLDRPEARNALNSGVLDALDAAVAAAAEDPAVRVLVLDAAGERAFCAGADLDELRGLSGLAARAHLARGQRVLRRLETCGVPSIAAVRGWALGGGFELALACSLIVGAESARFGLPEARLGLMPGYGGTQRLTRAVGPKAALTMMLTAEPINARRAWELGLLARPPVQDEELDERTSELAALLASRSPSSLASVLECVDAAHPPDAALRHETALAGLATASPAAAEGISAFLEGRPPAFQETWR
jgi:enoyl-CoA hydratase